jgi:hypothetical protein
MAAAVARAAGTEIETFLSLRLGRQYGAKLDAVQMDGRNDRIIADAEHLDPTFQFVFGNIQRNVTDCFNASPRVPFLVLFERKLRQWSGAARQGFR